MTRLKIILLIAITATSFNVSANTGKEIYERYCTVCHSPSMSPMFGSPAVHDLQAWQERKDLALIKAIEENESIKNATTAEQENIILKVLVNSATNGTDKGMPPMGTCMDCTDEELKLTIKFMSSSE